jgi:hypothetical protein
MFYCALLAQPKEPRMIFKLNEDREIYLPTVNETYHTSTTFIHEIHKHMNNNMQEKLLFYYLCVSIQMFTKTGL